MRKGIQRRFAFICKSMLWSVLLYMVVMLVFNWQEVNNTLRGRHDVTVITDLLSDRNGNNNGGQKNISARSGIIATSLSLLRVITGITSREAH